MVHYNRIDVSKGIVLNKTNAYLFGISYAMDLDLKDLSVMAVININDVFWHLQYCFFKYPRCWLS